MKSETKQRIAGGGCLLSVVIAVLCIYRMIPHGLAGNTAKAGLYFGSMIAAIVIGMACGLVYYYSRSKAAGDQELEHMRIAAETLAYSGRKQESARPAAIEPNQSHARQVTDSRTADRPPTQVNDTDLHQSR